MTLTLITAFGFPLITAVGYTVLLIVYRARYGAEWAGARLSADGFYLFPAFLAVPVLAALSEPGVRHLIAHQFALVDGSASMTALVVLVAGAVGVGQFLLEGRAAAGEPLGDDRTRAIMLEGGTDNWRAFNPRPATYIVLGIVVVLAEEIIWRGVLVSGLIERAGWGELTALLIASLAFGVNHYYFGLRNIGLKTIFGAVLGALLLITGSLAAPIAAHFAFEALVGLQLTARRATVGKVSHVAG